MTADFKLSVEWEAVESSRGDEIRATWARFGLFIGGQCVTRVLDARSRSYRDHIFIPLYPVTEWLVAHWWPLLYEPLASGRAGYDQRHNLRFGREGYLFPNIQVEQDGGSEARLAWSGAELSDAISFVNRGAFSLPHDVLRENLTEWVELVVARLEQQGVQDTWLQREWLAIQQLETEEEAFCIACARMGLDPFQLPEPMADQVLQAAADMPEACHEEFFSAVNGQQLARDARFVTAAMTDLQRNSEPLTSLFGLLRSRPETLGSSSMAPWKQGYHLAAWLRSDRGAGTDPLPDDASLAELLSLQRLPVRPPPGPGARWCNALMRHDGRETGGFLAATGQPAGRFAFCRALCEFLSPMGPTTALVTSARTARQKRNRAFAAELLAPSDWLRQRYQGSYIGMDELQASAHELGVSEYVVDWQLRNHRIGTVDRELL